VVGNKRDLTPDSPIGETEDLNIRDVRNKFAHRIEQISFDHPEVAPMIESRVSASLQIPGKKNRDKFIDTFSGLAVIIYGTLQIDMRIKSVGETHQKEIIGFLTKVSEVAREATLEASGSIPDTQSTPPKDG
jgi:hypothetical protein